VEIPWGAFLMGYEGLKTSNYRYGRWKEAMALQQQLFVYLSAHRYPGAKAIIDDNPEGIQNHPLLCFILINVRRKQATDPKDKIFALYGVLTELGVPFPRPDYALSVEEIFREAVVASINYDKNLYVLYHTPSDRRLEGLSSWVPDWTEPGWAPEDCRYDNHDRFTASKSKLPIWTFSDNHSTLILSGKVIDTVIYRTDPLPEIPMIGLVDRGQGMSNLTETERDKISRAILAATIALKTWIEISQWADYPTGEPSKIALQRTLVNDYLESNNAFNETIIEAWLKMINTIEPKPVEILLGSLQLSNTTIEGQYNTLARMFNDMVLTSSQKKCFFFTENTYFGTAPDPLPTSLQPGDKIAIISGLEMPLLLRPVEGGYLHLTHVYVHGIMHGEMWPVIQDDLEEIRLL
jgi:hypothetical protein